MLGALVSLLSFAAAAGFTPGYAEGAHVQGPRPAPEIRRALFLAHGALDACASEDARGELFVDVDVLAAGFINRSGVFASGMQAGSVDEACVQRALRGMHLADRGAEPRTQVLVHLVVGAPLPHPTPRELGDALFAARSDLGRCEEEARRAQPNLNGSLAVRFHVENERGRGEIIGGTLANEAHVALRACVARALADVRVPGAREAADVVWPVFFARPPPPPPSPPKPRSAWEAPTLFQFLGCGGAFTG